MERVVVMEGVVGGTSEVITSFPKKPLQEGITMMDRKVALKLLNSQVSFHDLSLIPIPYRDRCFTFISISQLLDTIEEALRTLSNKISYVVIWIHEDKVILDIPDIDAKVVFHDANSQVFLDVLENICKNYIPEVIIYN